MFNDDRDLVVPGNITMYPRHWDIVRHFEVEMGYPSTSAALRRIIDEWLELKRQQNTARIAAGD
jgi:hypothetical protein